MRYYTIEELFKQIHEKIKFLKLKQQNNIISFVKLIYIMDQPLRNVIALRTRKITRSLFNRMPGRTHCVHVSVRVNAWLSAWLDGRGVPFSRSRGMQRGAFLLSSSYSPISNYLSSSTIHCRCCECTRFSLIHKSR